MQGGLEIPCLVKVIMTNTKKNNEILDRYLELICTFYTEPNPPVILGSILSDDFIMESNDGPKEKKKKCLDNDNSTTSKKKSEPKSMDIRKLFLEGGKQTKTKKKTDDIVIID